jgi:zinc protease
MKTISLYITLLVFAFTGVFAQVDRSQYPTPAPAPVINIGDAETFVLPNGLKVFVVENHKLPRVTFSLKLDRDPILEGNKAGYTGLVGPLMMGGTTSLNKDQLDEAIDQIGASINVSSTAAVASSLTKHQETLLDLFADVLFNPSFPQEELDKLKKQTISVLEAEKDDPNAIAMVVKNAVLYGKDHPYGENATEETVNAIEVSDIVNYYQSYFRPNISYMAIVGDITKSEAETLMKKYFGDWEKGEVPSHEWRKASVPAENQVILVDRPASVQSVISLTYPVELQYNSPDRISASVLTYILGGGASSRLFMNLRESRGYTYGAYSSISPDRISGNFEADASVRTEVTDSAAYQFFYELKNITEKTITDEELAAAKAYLTGSFGRSLENPATIANFALNTEIYDLPKDYYKNYLKNLDAVQVDTLNTIAPKYIKPASTYLIIVGNTAAFKDSIGQFGEVKNYTVKGDPQ